ncbi:hypothetical protein FACS1894110_14450 [Spirochaetia bacterium]|nr:hypothetical protein FACS1894110_14450 [Spirochaetia bacterium]
MAEKPEVFIIDSNALVRPYREFYPFDFAPSFWDALANWSAEDIADPWIIASAMANNYTVITMESGAGSLQKNQPSSNVKLPDICKQFNVKCENLFYLIRALSFKLGV